MLKFAEVFTDFAVLQRDMPIRIFGSCDENSKKEIFATLCGDKQKAKITKDHWEVTFEPKKTTDECELIVTDHTETISIKNVAIGEVWLAGGQSNMEFMLSEGEYEEADLTDCKKFRYLRMRNVAYEGEVLWRECKKEFCLDFSAVSHFFARKLSKEIDCMVGIISCNQGASRVESWIDINRISGSEYEIPEGVKKQDLTQFPFNNPMGWLYEQFLLPCVPYTIRGVIWYQGESNRSREEAGYYSGLFSLLTKNWREIFINEKLSFLTVQLSPFIEDEEITDWAGVREQQIMAMKNDSLVSMVTIGDVGDENNIHPPKKREIGNRLALCAMNKIYGIDVEYSGPIFNTVTKNEKEVICDFEHSEGLHIDGELEIFVHDERGRKVSATSKIVDNKLVVDIQNIEKPKSISLGYYCNPKIALFNSSNFPASPFRAEI